MRFKVEGSKLKVGKTGKTVAGHGFRVSGYSTRNLQLETRNSLLWEEPKRVQIGAKEVDLCFNAWYIFLSNTGFQNQ